MPVLIRVWIRTETAPEASSAARQLLPELSAAAVAAEGAPGMGGRGGGGAGSTGGVRSEAAGGAGGLGRIDSRSEGEEEVSLKFLSKQIADMNLNVNTQFASMETLVAELRGEFKVLREEMVSKEQFGVLEARVTDLESHGLPNSELKILRQ